MKSTVIRSALCCALFTTTFAHAFAPISADRLRDVAHRVQAAALIIDAENEELFDIRDNGRAVHATLRNRVPTRYELVEGITHYGIYREKHETAVRLAIEWFEEHL